MTIAASLIGSDGQRPAVPCAVFITGASGFIGRALGNRYRALGTEVRGMDLKADEKNAAVAGDLSNPRGWADHAKGCDLFINTAAVVSLNAPWDLYRNVSVRGARYVAVPIADRPELKTFTDAHHNLIRILK